MVVAHVIIVSAPVQRIGFELQPAINKLNKLFNILFIVFTFDEQEGKQEKGKKKESRDKILGLNSEVKKLEL